MMAPEPMGSKSNSRQRWWAGACRHVSRNALMDLAVLMAVVATATGLRLMCAVLRCAAINAVLCCAVLAAGVPSRGVDRGA